MMRDCKGSLVVVYLSVYIISFDHGGQSFNYKKVTHYCIVYEWKRIVNRTLTHRQQLT